VVHRSEAGRVDEPRFLFDEDLIGHGKALAAIYPDTIFVCSHGEAPPRRTTDGQMYTWCVRRDITFVTADFNMLRDQAILRELLSHVGLRVIWFRQIRRQRADREIARIVGRWPHIRQVVMQEPDVRGFVLTGSGQLKRYRTISDVVVEVTSSR